MALPIRRSASTTRRWDPFHEFEDLYDRMGRWWDSAFRDWGATTAWSPPVDVEETDDAYLVEAELPGVRKDDITIELRDRELMISGESKERERTGVLHRQTRRAGQFTYRVTLPSEVEQEKIDASLTEGVLTVTVPKAAKAQPRRIEIRS